MAQKDSDKYVYKCYYKPFKSSEVHHFSRFEVVGRGTFGNVYVCEGTAPGIKHDILVAAKYVTNTDPANERDYRFLGDFNHPNVLAYFGTAHETVYGGKIIVSEYCNGIVRIHNK